MRVLALHFTPTAEINACQIYRANLPLSYMRTKGRHQTGWDHWFKILEERFKHDRNYWHELAESADVFVLPRVTAQAEQTLRGLKVFIELLHLHGKRAVYEVDDDFTNEHRDLTALGVYRAMEVAALCDAVTVTTSYLAELMRQRTKRPTYVLPNMLDPVLWQRPENHLPHEGLVIGLSGSATHREDWRVLESVLPRILAADYGFPVRLRLTGFHPEYLQGLPNADYLPPFEYSQYVELIRSCDLILAPVLPDDKFNLSKSPIKVIEGMGAARPVGLSHGGAACIATDNPVYRQALEHEKTGLLVEHTPVAWFTAIDRVIRDTELRERLQLSGQRYAWKHYDMSTGWTRWVRAYQQIIARPALKLVS